MAARGDPEQDALLPVVEDRRADRDVGQMRAAVVGRVDHVDVARFDPALVVADDGLDRAVHRAEMHRHVRRVRHQRAVVREHRAGEVEPLLDVHRIGGVLQRDAHLLGDRHEQVVEHLEHDRIGLGADRGRALELHDAREHEMVLRRDRGLPAGLDHDGLVRLDDDRRTFDLVAGLELVARVDGGVVPLAAEKNFVRRAGEGSLRARGLALLLPELRAAADRFDRHRLDHEVLLAVDEAELRLVRLLEGGLHRGERAGLHHQRGVGAGVADVRAHDGP